MIVITDGQGSGKNAGVTTNNRLRVAGVLQTLTEVATQSGDTYNISTSKLTLSTSGESALFYIKNNESNDLLIDNLIINIQDYSGTDGQPTLRVLRNPDAGTVVTDETAATQINRNFGSSQILVADLYEGGEGKTLTGQDSTVLVPLPSTALQTFNAFQTIVALPKGASFGVTYTPPSGVTSVDIIVAVNATLNGSQL